MGLIPHETWPALRDSNPTRRSPRLWQFSAVVALCGTPVPNDRGLAAYDEVPDSLLATFMGKLALAVSQLDALFAAWRDVRAQVRKSSWPQITAELAAMEAAPLRVLRDIRSRLRQGRYEFSPKWGYVKRKSGGSRRGITVHGISDRIVQRSILNVIYTRDSSLIKHLGEIPRMLDTPTTFAGTPGRGVPEAVAATVRAIRELALCPGHVGHEGLLSARPTARGRRVSQGEHRGRRIHPAL